MRSDREWRTLLLIAGCYLAWLALLFFHNEPGLILFMIALAVVMAFHSSLQHEVIHGHPLNSRRASEALVFLPIGLFIPFIRFRDTHLAHHQDECITDPYDDPESNYLDPKTWEALPRGLQVLYRFNNTLFGRMLIGPVISYFVLVAGDARLISRGEWGVARGWAWHLAGLPFIMLALYLAKFPVPAYLAAAYFALSILKIRTYLEHRAFEQTAGRSVIVEDQGPLALLFLNNNFHAVHHSHPGLAWYELPAKYRANRENYLARNRHYLYANYGEIFKAHFFRAKDEVAHPLRRSRR